MSSLVEELQRDALNSQVDVADLLRKALVVATKLKLDQLRAWCKLELDGYADAPIPDYRRIGGTVRAWNPYRGWIPFFTDDTRLAATLSTYKANDPIGQLQHFVANSTNGLIVRFPADTQFQLMQTTGVEFEVSLHISDASVAKIIDAVRNAILEWSLKLETDGIVGDGMSFNVKEKQIAEQKSDELQSVVNINVGTMVNSSLQQGSVDSQQSNQAS